MQTTKTLTGIVLAELGFVHVTGLPTYQVCPGDESYRIQARERWLGRWDVNNGMMVAVTMDGEVWLADALVQQWDDVTKTSRHPSEEGTSLTSSEPSPFRVTMKKLCPNGEGAGVPCSNGEFIPGNLILERLASPASDCRGFYPSEPKVA